MVLRVVYEGFAESFFLFAFFEKLLRCELLAIYGPYQKPGTFFLGPLLRVSVFFFLKPL